MAVDEGSCVRVTSDPALANDEGDIARDVVRDNASSLQLVAASAPAEGSAPVQTAFVPLSSLRK